MVDVLNASAPGFSGGGRRYQGGLEKFEPKEMEGLLASFPAPAAAFPPGGPLQGSHKEHDHALAATAVGRST